MSAVPTPRGRRLAPAAGLIVALLAGPAAADNLPAPRVKQVKGATAHLRVTLADGKVVEGSGFFAAEPGVLLTNAHVVGMLDSGGRRPRQVEVDLNSGEADARTVKAEVLGVDTGSDLAALRVDGADLPPPLKLGAAAELGETGTVYVFGFPFGRQFGKNITVTSSSVSSLRSENGALKQVQVNGGINPGNSGGPVVNPAGEVVGVAVSAVRGTNINFAVPAEAVGRFLAGQVTALGVELAIKDGDKIKVPYKVNLADPLGKVTNIAISVWTGTPGPIRPAAETEPKPLPGDADLQAFPVPSAKSDLLTGELSLPPLPAGKSYFARLSYTDGAGKAHYRPGFGFRPTPVDRVPVTLAYKPRPASRVELTSDASLKLRDPDGDSHTLQMTVRPKFNQRRVGAGDPARFRVNYPAMSITLNLDNKPMRKEFVQRLAEGVVKYLVTQVEMDADGGVLKATDDDSKAPDTGTKEEVGMVAEQLGQSFEMMTVPLPGGELKPGQSWKAQRVIGVGPPWASVPAQADIRYTYLGMAPGDGGKPVAVIEVKGPVKPSRGGGVDVRGALDGLARVDAETGEVVSSKLTVKCDFDLPMSRGPAWKANGSLALQMKRGDIPPPAPAKKGP